ncbi:hypothetical protein MELE44368_19300 [Mycolicibacterium elephantis DSM 44368]|uniref:Uncharacterized protein n=1 Tax=Mycolicibacterium elephantis DSM 44368 TaxID=1335622 RepID=A0A439DU46_9MYCO|nr:hypothetical protein MELE44368_19300 [Mycolicibacterium elephantis DSM 44368]
MEAAAHKPAAAVEVAEEAAEVAAPHPEAAVAGAEEAAEGVGEARRSDRTAGRRSR